MTMTPMTIVTAPPPPAARLERAAQAVTVYVDGLWTVIQRHARSRPRRAAEAEGQAQALSELLAAIEDRRPMSYGGLIWLEALRDELDTAATRRDVAAHPGWSTALVQMSRAIGDLTDALTRPEEMAP